ncbi:MAG TPA: glycerophosphodiester phosphodiesterase family protein, partial [Deinococcales bacterium]|nr:glycerophosphodiester phosphodiesterase family protein [Deinococcales bacterium]
MEDADTTHAGSTLPSDGWRLRDHVALEDVLVQSHRGAGVLAPENTMAAFRLAWSLGTVPEADLRQTRDGEIVAFH